MSQQSPPQAERLAFVGLLEGVRTNYYQWLVHSAGNRGAIVARSGGALSRPVQTPSRSRRRHAAARSAATTVEIIVGLVHSSV